MKTSSYFERALFSDNATAIDEWFEQRCDQLFEPSNDRSHVEFYIQLQPDKDDKDTQATLEAVSKLPVSHLEQESDSGSDPSSPIEQSKYSGRPPRYVGAPIYCRKILDAQSLTEVAAVRLPSVAGMIGT